MSANSKIEWVRGDDGTPGLTWNPIRARNRATGKRGWFCIHVSEGCRNCYAERKNVKGGATGGTGDPFKASSEQNVEVYLDEKTLLQPLHWRKPHRVFVCSMSDLYGPWVKDEWLDRIKAVEALCPHITFIELTKRPERMREYVECLTANRMRDAVVPGEWPRTRHETDAWLDPNASPEHRALYRAKFVHLPLSNVWLGTSIEDQATAAERIQVLLDTPAAIRFASYEPALGPVDFKLRFGPATINALTGIHSNVRGEIIADGQARIDQIIVGGESGPGARPFDISWARQTIAQCKAAGVACFVKQLGAHPFESYTEFVKGLPVAVSSRELALHDRKGGEPSEWPVDLRVREFPEALA